MYKRFLAASPNAANRAEVERRVAELEADLAAKKRKDAAESPPAPVPTQSAESAPTLPATVPSPISAAPSTPPANATESPGTVLPPPAATTVVATEGPSLRYWRWIGTGVTVALAGGAIVSGALASSRFNDLKNSCGATSTGCSDGDVNGLKSRALLTNILWAAAGVAAVGTGVIFYLTPRESAVQVAWRF